MVREILVSMFLVLIIPSFSNAQCVGEILGVNLDGARGSIQVETRYTLNGNVVNKKGRVRYDERSGTNAEIILKAKEDVKNHCEVLLKRDEVNRAFILDEKLKRASDLSNAIITDITSDLVGVEITVGQASKIYKGKEIIVTHDHQNTIQDTSVPDPIDP